jgi:3',5'-cyclic AMP phosphodiesterase CpdA
MLVAFSTVNRYVLATRIHPAGTADPDVLVAHRDGAYPRYPAASWNGSHFLVTWIDSSVTDDLWRATISGRRVTRDLGIDGDILALADGKEVDPFETPGLASNSGEWFLAWSHANQVRLARIAANGSILSELPALHGSAPQLTFAGRQLVLAAKSFGNVTIQAGEIFTTIPSLAYDGFSLTSRAGKWYTAFTRRGGTEVGHVERAYVASPGPRRRTVR